MKALVIAHRGASGTELENSLAAFRAAAPQGADGVELDVHASADGELFVHHDETVDGRSIARSSARTIAALRLQNGEPVPTLSQALAAIPPPLEVFVEVKSLAPRWDERLLETLDRGPNPTGYAVHGFDEAIVQRLAERRPALRRGAFTLDAVQHTRASILWQDRSGAAEPLVRTAHAAGVQAFVWTVDDPAEMTRLVGWGVDGICTNFPERARRAVDGHRRGAA
ncbi:MAG TPA: glycerophosphodiester phosphodiesterase [Gemmatimonadales bacterium]